MLCIENVIKVYFHLKKLWNKVKCKMYLHISVKYSSKYIYTWRRAVTFYIHRAYHYKSKLKRKWKNLNHNRKTGTAVKKWEWLFECLSLMKRLQHINTLSRNISSICWSVDRVNTISTAKVHWIRGLLIHEPHCLPYLIAERDQGLLPA